MIKRVKAALLRGFSLVELAIVMSIIGFIIFIVVGTYSLIDSAKVNKVLLDWQFYRYATKDFKEIYGYWPGDIASTDMDGKIAPVSGSSYYGLPSASGFAFNGSGYTLSMGIDFFKQLALVYGNVAVDTNMSAIKSSCSSYNNAMSGAKIGHCWPQTPLSETSFYVASSSHIANYYVSGRKDTIPYYYTFGDSFIALEILDNYDTVEANRNRIPVDIIHKIDQKGDDGKPFSGEVVLSDAKLLSDGISKCYNGTFTRNIGDLQLEYATSIAVDECGIKMLIDSAKNYE